MYLDEIDFHMSKDPFESGVATGSGPSDTHVT